jgi:putative ABC transport system permease protein
VTAGYFETMKIPLRRGRTFDQRDTSESPPVVIVNDTFARLHFPGADPVGQRIVLTPPPGEEPDVLEVVGVVGDSHQETLNLEPGPEIYVPHPQQAGRRVTFVFRTGVDKLSGLDATVKRAVHEVDKDIYVPAGRPMQELITANLARPRFNMMLLGIFAGVAMILAAIGIYGVIAYSVTQRTREIGIRMALGAQRTDMLGMVLRQSLTLVAIGLAIGLIASLAGTRLMSSLLFGVGAADWSTYGIVIGLLGGTALLASYIPARRAMKVDPMVALRYE